MNSTKKKKPLEQKDPGLLELINVAAKSAGGPGIYAGEEICSICGIQVNISDFDSELSQKEWYISKMCQECQDTVWDVDQEDLDGFPDSLFSFAWGKKE